MLNLLSTLPPEATDTMCTSQMSMSKKKCLETIIMGLQPERNHLSNASWLQAQLPQGPGLGLFDLHGLAPLAFSACLIQSLHKLARLDPCRFNGITQQPEWQHAVEVACTALESMRTRKVKVGSVREDLTDHKLAAMVAREHRKCPQSVEKDAH